MTGLVESLGPELFKPLIRILGLIRIRNLALELCNVIPCLVIQSILLIGSVSDIVWNSLHVVADFLVNNAGDVVDLSILQTELITVVGVDLKLLETFEVHGGSDSYDAHSETVNGNDVLNRGVALGLVETVAARLVEGSETLSVEAGDVVLATKRVVLEDLRIIRKSAFSLYFLHTLSVALRAPPPMTLNWVFRPLDVRASSQTSSHQTAQISISQSKTNKAAHHSQPRHHPKHGYPQPGSFQ